MHMMPASYQSVLHGPLKTQPGRGHFCFGHLAIAWRLLLIRKYMLTTICTQLTQCKVWRVKSVAQQLTTLYHIPSSKLDRT